MRRFLSIAMKCLAWLVALLLVGAVVLISRTPVTPKVIFLSLLGNGVEAPDSATVQQQLSVPPGFILRQYATGLGKPRLLEITAADDLLVSRPRTGDILLLKRDENHDGRHDGQVKLMENLNYPHGLALHEGWLYVGESGQVGRIRFDPLERRVAGDYEVIVRGLPEGGNHRSKSIHIQGDSLFVSMGSSCNVCEEDDRRRAAVMRFGLDGSGGEIFASGLRNSVGLDSAPWSGELYATDNGRDLLGDDYPVCELNLLQAGRFYGWPYVNGFGDADPDYGGRYPEHLPPATPPVFGFRAHNAPLGIHFLRNVDWTDAYHHTALVALHGSWNRSAPDGYAVIALRWHDDGHLTSSEFVTGFERRGRVIGRPVDIAEDSRGCVYISDDYAGSIYQVCRQQGAPPSGGQTTTPP